MTDHVLPDPDPDPDEVASAHLDGVTSADEAATVEADPSLADRVAQFRRGADALSAPVPPLADTDAERLLASALAVHDQIVADTRPSGPVAPADQLKQRRAHRARRAAWLPAPAVAAAVILVVALVGLGLIISDSRRSSSDQANSSATGGSTTTAGAGSGGAGAGGAPSADAKSSAAEAEDGAGSSAPRSADVPALGTFVDQAALTAVLAKVDLTTLARPQGESPRDPSTTSQTAVDPLTSSVPTTASGGAASYSDGAVDRCDDVIRAVPGQDLGRRLAVASATLDGRPVLVYSHPALGVAGASPVTLLTVADAESCVIAFAVQR